MQEIVQIYNGERVKPTFDIQEYQNRQASLRQFMEVEDIAVVLFTSIHNVNYYTDFLYCSFGRPYGCLITQKTIKTISANIDGGQPWRRTVGDDNIIFTDWQQDSYFKIIKNECESLSGKIGIEFDHINIERHNKLKDAVPHLDVIDISQQVMQQRMIKSQAEIEHITKATAIADLGGGACVEAIGENIPEYEVALHATQVMIKAIAQQFPHSELMDTWTWFQSGINTDGAHNPVTTRKIQKGDILSLNCFPMISGYYVALERTLFSEQIDQASLKLWEINCQVHTEGQKLLKPGSRCGDIATALNKIFEEHNLLQYRTFGYGHSFGVLSHYYGREPGLELREDIDTILEPNMVVSMEPMIMIPEGIPGAGGYREHDILVITENGNRNITGFPYGPENNIIKS